MSAPLSILHAPGYAPRIDLGAVRFACSTTADSIGFTEAYRVIPILRRRVSYRCRVGKSPTDTRAVDSPRGDAGDVPILIRRRHRLVDWHAEAVTDPGQPRKWAPERWLTEATYLHTIGEVTHLVAHPNPRFVDGGLWDAYMARLESRLVRAARLGRHLILTGDLQFGRLGPYFDRLDLDYWRLGIDYVAHSPHLRLVERAHLTDPSQVGVENPHPWMLARFAL